MTVTFALTHRPRLAPAAFAGAAGIHPDLLDRLVVLGLLVPVVDADGARWFTPAQVATVARVRRLHDGLPLNYAAVGVVMDLLDRIDALEAALRRRPGA